MLSLCSFYFIRAKYVRVLFFHSFPSPFFSLFNGWWQGRLVLQVSSFSIASWNFPCSFFLSQPHLQMAPPFCFLLPETLPLWGSQLRPPHSFKACPTASTGNHQSEPEVSPVHLRSEASFWKCFLLTHCCHPRLGHTGLPPKFCEHLVFIFLLTGIWGSSVLFSGNAEGVGYVWLYLFFWWFEFFSFFDRYMERFRFRPVCHLAMKWLN